MANTSATLQILVEIQATLADLQAAIGGTDSLGASAGTTSAALAGVAAQIDAIKGASGGLATAKSALSELTGAGSGFLSMLEGGFAIDFAGRITEGIVGIGEAFKHAIEEGVEYNARMETTAIGLAATLRSVEPAQYFNFDEARKGADVAMDALREKASSLGVDFHSLAEAYSANLHALIEGGVTKPGEQITLVSTLMQAAASKGITGIQALRDSIDILNGRAQNIVLAREIGLENNELKAAAASGQEYGYIMGKLGGYLEAADANASSFAGRLQVARNEWEQLEGIAAVPAFDAAKDTLAVIDKELASVAARGFANTIGIQMAQLIEGGKAVAEWFGKTPIILKAIESEVPGLASSLSALRGALDQGQLPFFQQQNAKIAQTIRDQVEDAKSAFDVEQARIGLANALAAAHQKVAEAQGAEKMAAEGLLDALSFTKEDFDIIVGQGHEAARAAEGITTALQGANEQLSEMMAKLPNIVAEMRQAANEASDALQLANATSTAAKINVLSGRQQNNVQYLNEELKKLGYSGQPVTDASQVPAVTQAIGSQQGARPSPTGGMLGLTPAGGQVTDASALGNVAAVQQKMLSNAKQLDALNRQKTDEDQRQADILAKSKGDYDYRVQHADLLLKGEKGAADQLERNRNIQNLAVKLSKDQTLTWDDAVRAAANLYDKEVAVGDAAKAAASAKKGSAAAGKEAATAAKDEAAYTRQIEQDRLKSIQSFGSRVENDPFLDADSKAKLMMSVYAQERQQLENIIKLDAQRMAMERNSANPAMAAQLRQDTKGISDATNHLADVVQKMRTLTVGGTLQKSLVTWVNQFGTAAEAVASTITSVLGHAVEGLSSAISGLVLGTMTWKQAFSQAASAIVQDIIRIIVQQTVGRAVMSAVNAAFGSEDAATSSGLAQAAAAS